MEREKKRRRLEGGREQGVKGGGGKRGEGTEDEEDLDERKTMRKIGNCGVKQRGKREQKV